MHGIWGPKWGDHHWIPQPRGLVGSLEDHRRNSRKVVVLFNPRIPLSQLSNPPTASGNLPAFFYMSSFCILRSTKHNNPLPHNLFCSTWLAWLQICHECCDFFQILFPLISSVCCTLCPPSISIALLNVHTLILVLCLEGLVEGHNSRQVCECSMWSVWDACCNCKTALSSERCYAGY